MSLDLFKIIFAIMVLLVAIVGGLWPFLKKSHFLKQEKMVEFDFPVGESIASGIFLGAGLLHMLPDATQAFSKAGYQYPFACLIAGMSFLILLLLEHINNSFQHRAVPLLSSIALLSAVMLSIHSLLEGAAVGFSVNFAVAFIIFIAIVAHKGAASFALSINLNRSQLSFIHRVIIFSIFVLMTPIGILVANWVVLEPRHNTILMPIFTSLAAGTFLYIGTLHGLGRASLIKHCCNIKEFFFMSMSFILMAIVAIWT